MKLSTITAIIILNYMPIIVQANPIVIKNANIMTLADGQNNSFKGYVIINQGKIFQIGKGNYTTELTQAEIIDANGKILIPGFVSGHNHLWQSAFRGIAADGELMSWLQELHWTYSDYITKGDLYQFTLHGSLDQLSHGITTTYDHTQRMGATDDLYLESFKASIDSSQNFIFAYNANIDQSEQVIRQSFENFYNMAQKHIGKSNLLNISVNAAGNFSSMEKFNLELQLAKKYNLTAQIHYLEPYTDRKTEQKQWPEFLRIGAVDENISYAHFIHTTDKILRDTAQRGASMIWNPLSNGRLASGLADIPKYLDMGINVGMGVDGAASGDISDPFENMRMGLYATRMHYRNAKIMQPIDMLRLHTLSTAKILKVDDQVGSIEIGKRADLLLIDPSEPATGAIFDVAATLVFASSAANIDKVFVNGKLQIDDGELLHHDMTNIQSNVNQRVERIRYALALSKL